MDNNNNTNENTTLSTQENQTSPLPSSSSTTQIQTIQSNSNSTFSNSEEFMNLFFNFLKNNFLKKSKQLNESKSLNINYNKKEIILSLEKNNFKEWKKYIKSIINPPYQNYFEEESVILSNNNEEDLFEFMFNTLDEETQYSLLDYNFESNPRKLLNKITEIINERTEEDIRINKRKLTEMKFNYKDKIENHFYKIGIISKLEEYSVKYTEYEQTRIIINTLPMNIKNDIRNDIYKNKRKLLDISMLIIRIIKVKQKEYYENKNKDNVFLLDNNNVTNKTKNKLNKDIFENYDD